MKLALNDRCELVDGDGKVRGRLVGLEIELEIAAEIARSQNLPASTADEPLELLDPRRGVLLEKNNSNDNSKSNVKSKEAFGKEVREPSPAVAEVWALYSQLVSSKRTFGPKQRADIERALKVRDLASVKWAVVGLSRSPHHNGHNDSGTKYLDIRYALRGNGARGESNEERVDRMAEIGRAGGAQLPSPQAVADGFGPAEQLSERAQHGDIAQLVDVVRRNARRPPYPEDRLAFADVLEAERIERRDAAVIELQDRYGIESRISSDGRTVGFKEGSS
jgi:hypothetical protein